MSKQIAQTVGNKRVAILIAILAAFAVLATVATQWRSSEAQVSPSSVIFTKSCGPQELVTVCSIKIVNTSPLEESETEEGSETLEPQFTLPGFLIDDPDFGQWSILSAYAYSEEDEPSAQLECSAYDDGFACEIPPLIGRHLNEDGDDFAFGFVEIVAYASLPACEVGNNVAILTGTVLLRSVGAAIGASCATPTPTATNTPVPPTATPTAIVTQPPPPTATATLNDPVPTATNTPNRSNAPRPPNTGDSGGSDLSQGGDATATWLYAALGLGALAFAIGGTAIARRSR